MSHYPWIAGGPVRRRVQAVRAAEVVCPRCGWEATRPRKRCAACLSPMVSVEENR
jgi:hypothetical protein